ncbi:hypothetical protein FPV67DRAFT_1448512 [Lyophyllum atratum]|nr:hypothetical protein FPV67DRAFT_1448512 [Lyophyllum atratum]
MRFALAKFHSGVPLIQPVDAAISGLGLGLGEGGDVQILPTLVKAKLWISAVGDGGVTWDGRRLERARCHTLTLECSASRAVSGSNGYRAGLDAFSSMLLDSGSQSPSQTWCSPKSISRTLRVDFVNRRPPGWPRAPCPTIEFHSASPHRQCRNWWLLMVMLGDHVHTHIHTIFRSNPTSLATSTDPMSNSSRNPTKRTDKGTRQRIRPKSLQPPACSPIPSAEWSAGKVFLRKRMIQGTSQNIKGKATLQAHFRKEYDFLLKRFESSKFHISPSPRPKPCPPTLTTPTTIGVKHGRHQAPSSISRELPAARNHNLNQRRELVNASDEIKALKKRHAREVLDVGEVLRSCQEDMKRERREVSSLKAKLVMQSTAGHLTLTMQDQRYLGNSLSGDSKTLMLFTLSPLVGFVDDPAVRREGEWQDDWDGEEVKLQTTQ